VNPANIQAPVALVTGSALRIGAAITAYLHQQGYRVVIHYHQSKEAAQLLTNTLNKLRNNSARAVCADLNNQQQAQQLVAKAQEWGGQLDLLVNNASIFKRTDFTNFNDADWDAMFTLNVKAPFWLSDAAFAHLKVTQGAIVNITDIHADKPLKDYAVYCQTKAALMMQTKALAREFAPQVRVNAVAPGAIAWPEQENTLSSEIQQKIIARTALKQHGKAEYVAQAVFALANNPFITGETLHVDGGRGLT